MDNKVFDNKWMSVRKTEKGFLYSERKCKDSIAVLCHRVGGDGVEVLIRYQPLVVNGGDTELFPCPITGSLDFDGEDPLDVAVREVREEAGFVVTRDMITSFGSYIVGTQTNERVYLFLLDTDGLTPEEPKGDGGFHESISHNDWESLDSIMKYEYSAFAQYLIYFYTLE